MVYENISTHANMQWNNKILIKNMNFYYFSTTLVPVGVYLTAIQCKWEQPARRRVLQYQYLETLSHTKITFSDQFMVLFRPTRILEYFHWNYWTCQLSISLPKSTETLTHELLEWNDIVNYIDMITGMISMPLVYPETSSRLRNHEIHGFHR